MIFKPSTPESIFADLKNSFDLDEEVCFIVKPTKNYIYVGADGYNVEACKDLFVLNLGYSGGTIVTTDKDLNFVIALKTSDRLFEIQGIINKSLNNLGVQTTIDGNDILINGFKICGCAENMMDKFQIYYYQISFDANVDLIKSICTKPLNKIPSGINNFSSINRDDLEGEIRKWLH